MAGVKEKDKLDVLILGMGTGTFATQCNRYFDGMDITGVEIDQSITDLAREYFELSEDVPVVTYDGRAYLNADDRKYDVIMVDAYQDITIPFQMSSVEFFTLVRQHLNDNGVMVVNMNMRSEEQGDITAYLADTISSVFANVYTVDVSGSTNRELFAFEDSACMERFEAGRTMEESEDLSRMMGRVADQMSAYSAGSLIMTDDKAPVELLGMKVIDSLIGEEASFYKEIYKEQGLKGLLEWL